MNEKEAISRLNNIETNDIEVAHIKADEILLEFLRYNGFEAVANMWDTVDERVEGFLYS